MVSIVPSPVERQPIRRRIMTRRGGKSYPAAGCGSLELRNGLTAKTFTPRTGGQERQEETRGNGTGWAGWEAVRDPQDAQLRAAGRRPMDGGSKRVRPVRL